MITSRILLSFIAAAGLCLAACPYGYGTEASLQRAVPVAVPKPSVHKKGVMYMNRIAPSSSTLYIANRDGTNERQLLHDSVASFDLHASFSPDGEWITFTSERAGDGQADIYRVRPDGSDIEPLVTTRYVEDAGVLSPDGSSLAYVSTGTNWTANIYVQNLTTKRVIDLTSKYMGANTSPHGFFRPSWSPDGKWIAFTSDRNTEWIGNTNGTAWEHAQHLSVYAIRPDGNDFRQVVSKTGYSLGSPKWSSDGLRLSFYEMRIDDTFQAHTAATVGNVTSQIASVDFESGSDYRYHTSGPGCKISGQLLPDNVVGYSIKVGLHAGLNYSPSNSSNSTVLSGDTIRSPSWSPDGKTVVYEKASFSPIRPMNKPLYSWDDAWDYRFSDTFPTLSSHGVLAITQGQLGNGSLITTNPNGTNEKLVFDAYSTGQVDPELGPIVVGGAYQPAWSSDGKWLAFGLGAWFTFRPSHGGWIYRINSDGSNPTQLTNGVAGVINSGFPTISPDGTRIVYRDFGSTIGLGLRMLNIGDGSITNLTNSWDNLPQWSLDGKRIMFTRKTYDDPEKYYASDVYDIFTMKPDGTDVTKITTSGANDAHAVWAPDGGILWDSGMYGFRDESAIYDNTHQPYGKIMWMNTDGSDKKVLTDSLWEDTQPVYVPRDNL